MKWENNGKDFYSYEYSSKFRRSMLVSDSHYRRSQNCRVFTCLPSVLFRTLGKQSICQVPTKKHSAKKDTRQTKLFAECLGVGTRQGGVCRVSKGWALGKQPISKFSKKFKNSKQNLKIMRFGKMS